MVNDTKFLLHKCVFMEANEMSQKAFGAETDIFNTYRLSSYVQNKYLNTFSKMAQFCEV